MTVDTGTSQTLTASGSGTASQSNPGVGITVNATTPGINLVSGTGSASNYTLSGGTHTVDITATSLTLPVLRHMTHLQLFPQPY